MTILVDKYKNHPIHQSVDDVLQYISDYRQHDNLTDEQKDSLNAYEQLLVYAKYILKNNISQIVPTPILSNLNNQIISLKSAHVINIENSHNFYSAITADLSKIPFREQKGVIKVSLDKIIDNFLDSQSNIKTEITNEIDSFKEKQKGEISSWVEKKEELEKEVKSLEEKKNLLKKDVLTLEKKVTTESDRLDTVISNFKVAYEAKETGFQTSFDAKIAEHEKTLKEIEDASNEKVVLLLEGMRKKEAEVERLWGIIGKAAVSGNSQNYANNAKDFASKMMGISLVIMLGVVIFLATTFYKDITSENFNPMNLLYRIPLSFTFLLPAWYCANISSKQRNREFQLRDFEIKTAALEPFIEQMKMESQNSKESEKDKTKLDLVKDIFSNDLKDKNLNDEHVIISKDVLDVFKAALGTVSKIKG